MSERYTKLFALQENLYAVGSPVVIAAGALLKDNQTGKVLAQIKLRSISPKTMKAVTVAIHPKDTMGKDLGDAVEYQYLDLSEKRDAEFAQKQPIALPDPSTRAFSVEVKAVIFTDNSQWTGTEAPWEVLTGATPLKKAIPNLELVRQYKLEFGAHNDYLYTETKDIWYCDCGAINRVGELRCHHCNTEVAQLQNLDWDALKRKRDERIAAEKAQAEKERAAAEESARKARKLALIIIPIMLAAVIGGVMVSKYQARQQELQDAYDNAVTLLDADQYDAAMAAFEALGNFKDSRAQAANVENVRLGDAYDAAMALLNSGKYSEAIAAFQNLGAFRDAEEMVLQAEEKALQAEEARKEAIYQKALGLLSCGLDTDHEKNAEAKELLETIPGYKDTDDILTHFVWRPIRFVNSADFVFYYAYDEYGRIVKEERSSFVYNDDGQIISEVKSGDLYTYTYDEDGKLIRYACEEENNETVYSYDANGRVSSEVYTSDTMTKRTTYDANGNIATENSDYRKGSKYNYRYEYSYSDGLLVEKTTHYSSTSGHVSKSEVRHETYTYDGEGKLLSRETWQDSKNYWTGNYMKLNDMTYIYYYDDRGNLERVVRDYNKKTSVTERYAYGYVYLPKADPAELAN